MLKYKVIFIILGMPAAWMVLSNATEDTINYFLKSIHSQTPSVLPKFFMSDKDHAQMNAIRHQYPPYSSPVKPVKPAELENLSLTRDSVHEIEIKQLIDKLSKLVISIQNNPPLPSEVLTEFQDHVDSFYTKILVQDAKRPFHHQTNCTKSAFMAGNCCRHECSSEKQEEKKY